MLTLRWTSQETYLVSIASLYPSSGKSGTMYKAVYGPARVSVCFHPIFNFIRDRIIAQAIRHYAVKQYFCGRVTWASENPKLVVGVILLL